MRIFVFQNILLHPLRKDRLLFLSKYPQICAATYLLRPASRKKGHTHRHSFPRSIATPYAFLSDML